MATEAKPATKAAPASKPAAKKATPATTKAATTGKKEQGMSFKMEKNKFAETMKFIYFVVPVFISALMSILLFVGSPLGKHSDIKNLTRAIWGVNYGIIVILWIEMFVYSKICKKVNYTGGSTYFTWFIIMLHILMIIFISLDFAGKRANLGMSSIYFIFVPFLSAFWFVMKHPKVKIQ